MQFKHFILLLSFFVGVTSLFGQRDIPDNLPNFDQKKIHFGFSLGGGLNGFRLTQDLTKSDSLIKLEVLGQPGFNVNVVTELHLGPYMGLRFTPGLAFSSRILRYTFFAGDNVPFDRVDRIVESTYLDFPLVFKYRSKRVNNFASYVTFGGRYSLDLASESNVNNLIVDQLGEIDDSGIYRVKLTRHNYHLETGVGFDFFFEYFKFTPEFKFCYGLNSVIYQDNTEFSTPITGLHSRIFMICINFEG